MDHQELKGRQMKAPSKGSIVWIREKGQCEQGEEYRAFEKPKVTHFLVNE